MTLLVTYVTCLVSAVFPLVNAEAYLVAVSFATDSPRIWLLSGVAAAGQTTGKLLWYEAARRSLSWPWVAKKLDRPQTQETLTRWRERFDAKPWLWSSVLFLSATVGLPPLLVLAVIAGQLQVSRIWFTSTVLVGRTLRFAAILGGLDWVTVLLMDLG
ncbi:MAG: hypothetical protein WBG89_08175 [Ornithinimicrobium sp.]